MPQREIIRGRLNGSTRCPQACARLIATGLLFASSIAAAQPEELRLWPGKAPGSESWAQTETVTPSPSGDRIVTNVSEPTLTVFLPEASRATGVADAQQALRLVRRNAAEWRVDPARVGLMGFSAGGGVAVSAALAPQSDASPDFLVSLYGPALVDVHVPEHAPPLFIAVGNAHYNVTNGVLALFAAWKAAGKPAEIHVYDQVSAGFGMTKRGLPVDAWTERLHEWLVARQITSR